jgi:hypothetical protein
MRTEQSSKWREEDRQKPSDRLFYKYKTRNHHQLQLGVNKRELRLLQLPTAFLEISTFQLVTGRCTWKGTALADSRER